jgi:hypothetical protein
LWAIFTGFGSQIADWIGFRIDKIDQNGQLGHDRVWSKIVMSMRADPSARLEKPGLIRDQNARWRGCAYEIDDSNPLL